MAFLRAVAAIVLVTTPVSPAVGRPCPESCTPVQEGETAAFRAWVSGPVSYLFSAKEKKIADALAGTEDSAAAQQRAAFRHWFWERRDPSPGTLVNEFRDAFNDRVDYVNKEFGDAHTELPGWRTPPGVLHILLGPPTRVEARAGHLYGELEDTRVAIWTWELDEGSAIEAPFVETERGVVLLTTPDNVGMRARIDAALARAVTDCIHNRDLPFTGASPLADAPVANDWPAAASLQRTEQGIEGQATIPLGDLYGRPDGGDLRIDLRFELVMRESGAREPLGDITVVIGPQEFMRWHDRKLMVALWFPGGWADGDAGIVMTEVVSGRSVRLAEASRNDAIARAYAVEHLLGGAHLLAGGGAAFAFIPRRDTAIAVDESMWVLRSPQSFPGVVIDEPVRDLWLVKGQDCPSGAQDTDTSRTQDLTEWQADVCR